MNTVTTVERPKRRGRGAAGTSGSIREVRLVGGRSTGWATGDRVALAGRSYRVVDDSSGYTHLRPEPGAAGAG